MTTASEILERRFRESRDHVLLDTAGGRRFTYGAYYANARRIAALWSSQGLEPGDCVALHLPNGPAYPCLYLACAIGGFVACPISPDLLPAAVDDILALARPALVIRETPALDPGLAAPADGDIRFEGANAETFGIFFSSGTTGRPKGICHRLESFLGSALSFGRLAGFSAKTRLYHVLPMAYMAGFHNTMLTPLLAGATLVEGPQFSSRTALDFWSDPVARKANTLSLVPSIAAALCRLARDPGQARAAASGLRQVQSTAAPLNAALRGSFLETFGLPLQDCYGVTELGGPLTFQSHEAALAERPWVQPLPELACRLKNDASGEPELWVRSPFLMQGYLTETGFQAPELEDGFSPAATSRSCEVPNSASSGAAGTSSSAAALTSPRSPWRTPSAWFRASRTSPWSPASTTFGARLPWPASCRVKPPIGRPWPARSRRSAHGRSRSRNNRTASSSSRISREPWPAR
ncbi:MAG: AMP-binding protein [Kiloniellales bacterium]|nr:AMP-binding protein [Kiloniellales bacterium]